MKKYKQRKQLNGPPEEDFNKQDLLMHGHHLYGHGDHGGGVDHTLLDMQYGIIIFGCLQDGIEKMLLLGGVRLID
jgi:hypothetical protein